MSTNQSADITTQGFAYWSAYETKAADQERIEFQLLADGLANKPVTQADLDQQLSDFAEAVLAPIFLQIEEKFAAAAKIIDDHERRLNALDRLR